MSATVFKSPVLIAIYMSEKVPSIMQPMSTLAIPTPGIMHMARETPMSSHWFRMVSEL